MSLFYLSSGLQAEKHDQVQHVCCYFQEFPWTMPKLQIIIDNMLDNYDEWIMYYKCFRVSLALKTVEEGLVETFYQGIKLKNYNHFCQFSLIKSLYI